MPKLSIDELVLLADDLKGTSAWQINAAGIGVKSDHDIFTALSAFTALHYRRHDIAIRGADRDKSPGRRERRYICSYDDDSTTSITIKDWERHEVRRNQGTMELFACGVSTHTEYKYTIFFNAEHQGMSERDAFLKALRAYHPHAQRRSA